MIHKTLIFGVLICLFFNAAAHGAPEGKVIRAVRAEEEIKIDGLLTEKSWQKAVPATDFVQDEPVKGSRSSEKTTARVLYDDKFIYIGFECFVSDVESIQTSATRHDDGFWNDDYVEVMLDTFRDKRSAYIFSVNPLGTRAEGRYSPQGRWGQDNSWDCEWYAESKQLDDRWTAEIAIPFCELRFKRGRSESWGINFLRNIECADEEDIWSLPEGRSTDPAGYGVLVDLPTDTFVQSRPLEFKPYVTTTQIQNEDGYDFDSDAGVDLRIPMTSVTVDMTLNPDFAQVEADPQRINLSDIPMRFPEKRPFFMEGEELFSTPLDIFYTRTIIEPIVGAKAVGKAGRFNFAFFDTHAEATDDSPRANFAVGRVRTDIGDRSSIGVLVANKQDKNGSNRCGGLDLNLRLPDNAGISGQIAVSRTARDVTKSDYALNLSAGWHHDPFGISASFRQLGDEFSAESGFVPDFFLGKRLFGVEADLGQSFAGNILKRIGCGTEYNYSETLDGIKTNERYEIGGMLRVWHCFFHGGIGREYRTDPEDITVAYNDYSADGFMGFFPPKWIRLGLRYTIGTRDEKDIVFLGPELTLTPIKTVSIRIEGQILNQEENEDERILRCGIDYGISRSMTLRLSGETSKAGNRSVFALYSWEYLPESNFFLVYTYRDEAELTEHAFYVKVAHRIRWKPPGM